MNKKCKFKLIIFLLFFLIMIVFADYLHIFKKHEMKNRTISYKTSTDYYDKLFDLIEYDNYNMASIYNYSYNTIKIKHVSKKTNSLNDIVCILGILVNNRGIKIAKSMLDWLLPEYDVYCVYQKYPGRLFEYPALRFAQWLSLMFNIKIILYLHTKGAFFQNVSQKKIRKIWKKEFTKPRKNIYIKLLKQNITDISLPFRNGECTWFNGMFISQRAFNSIYTIGYNSTYRWYYEELFGHLKKKLNSIRYKGVLSDKIVPRYMFPKINKYLHYYKKIRSRRKNKRKSKKL